MSGPDDVDRGARAGGGQALSWMGRMPAEYITAELPPTAQRLLVAAQHILARDGYPGLTLRRIAEEAGEHKSLVVYHFESKAGLLAALVDSLWHDVDVDLFHTLEHLPLDSAARVDALIDAQHRLALLTDQYRMYFELLPACARDRANRERLAQLNGLYRQLGVSCLAASGLPAPELEPLASLLLAVGDGVAVLQQLVPQADDDGAYGLLKAILGVGPAVAWAPSPPVDLGPDTVASAPSGDAASRVDADPAVAATPDPLAELAPVARNLVRGAVRLLRRRGYAALTLEAIATEADEPRSAITYYFGDKRGLVLAVHASLLYQMRRDDERRFDRVGRGAAALDDVVAMLVELLADGRSYRVFFEVLPEILRDPELRARHERFDRWLLRSLADRLEGSGIEKIVACSGPLATLMLSALDGLAAQQLLEPRGFDPAPSLTALHTLIRGWLGERA